MIEVSIFFRLDSVEKEDRALGTERTVSAWIERPLDGLDRRTFMSLDRKARQKQQKQDRSISSRQDLRVKEELSRREIKARSFLFCF